MSVVETLARDAADADLVARAATLEVEAFLALQVRYGAYLRRTARRLGFGDRAEDAVQDVWLQLLRGRWQCNPDQSGDLRGFLYVVLQRMRARDARRRRHDAGIPVAAEDHDDEELVLVPMATDTHPLDVLIRTEQRETVRRAILALPPADQALLRLRYEGDGLTLDQIAARDGRTRSAIHLQLRRIHQQLAAACGVTYRTGQSPGHFPQRAGYTRRAWMRSRSRRRAREAVAS